MRMEVHSKGVVVIELEDELMPITTHNFLEYVDAGYYDGLIFHRVIRGFMVQGGGFSPNMVRASGGRYQLRHRYHSQALL